MTIYDKIADIKFTTRLLMSPKIPEVDSSVSGGGTKKLMRAACDDL